MATEKSSDSVMKLVFEGKPVYAECALGVAATDTMMSDFLPALHRQGSYSNFFEVEDFDLGLELNESDTSTTPAAGGGKFARWRSAAETEYKSIFYPLEFEKFTFKRTLDRASALLFQNCCSSKSFESASLVKRMAQGGVAGGAGAAAGYLRIDFTNVLITGIGWSDGDVVKESCEFICQGVSITYRGHAIDGTVNPSRGNEVKAVWPNPNNDRSLGIKSLARR